VSGAALYLHLIVLGLSLSAAEEREHPEGYVIRVWGIERLDPAHQERVRHLIREGKPALLRFFLSESPAALALRQEARYGGNRQAREGAA